VIRAHNKIQATGYPATKDFDAIADTLPSNARGDDGNNVILVPPPSADKTDGSRLRPGDRQAQSEKQILRESARSE